MVFLVKLPINWELILGRNHVVCFSPVAKSAWRNKLINWEGFIRKRRQRFGLHLLGDLEEL